MKVGYALLLLVAVGLLLYLPFLLLGISGHGIGLACAVGSFLLIGGVRRWWLGRRRPPVVS